MPPYLIAGGEASLKCMVSGKPQAFRNVLRRSGERHKKKHGRHRIGRALYPLLVKFAASSAIGMRATDKSCEAPPSLNQDGLSAALPFCSSTVQQPRSPERVAVRSVCEAPPPKRLAIIVQELDPTN
jgi:hypothetical protein